MAGPNRRTILKQGAALALTTLPAVEALAQIKLDKSKLERIPKGIYGTIVTRPRVDLLALNDPNLESYRAAIKAMQALPTSDPRNWTKQAETHLNHCPHQSWLFLPWHRAYLVAFERICRQLSGNANFALPYWDWTAHGQLPAAFATPTYNGQPNPLYDAKRASQTVSIPATVAGPSVMSAILAEPSFEVFASSHDGLEGPLESGPHDQTHIRVGGGPSGDMYTFMSPLDPIFWLHHCNIDRIWDQWNRKGNANTTNATWLNTTWTNQFVNAGGTPYTTKVSDNLNIGTLGYKYPQPLVLPKYDIVLRAIDLLHIPPVTAHENPGVLRLQAPLHLPITLKSEQIQILQRIRPMAPAPQPKPGKAPKTMAANQPPPRVMAFIRDVPPPAKGNAEVRVFVNDPNLKPDTPKTDPHYAGSFTFFASGHAGHGPEKHSYMIDLTRTLVTLKEPPTDKITIQLVAVPIEGVSAEGVEIRPGRVEIAVF